MDLWPHTGINESADQQHELFLRKLYRERANAASDAASDAEATRVLHLSPRMLHWCSTSAQELRYGPLISVSRALPALPTGPCCLMKVLGDKYTAAQVKGIDLSPIQPPW